MSGIQMNPYFDPHLWKLNLTIKSKPFNYSKPVFLGVLKLSRTSRYISVFCSKESAIFPRNSVSQPFGVRGAAPTKKVE